MKKLSALALVLFALLLVAGLSACGGGGSSDGGDPDSAASATPANGGDDTSDDGTSDNGGETATPEGQGDDGGSGEADLGDYFQALEEIATRTDADLEAVSNEISSAVFNTDQEEIEGVQSALQQSGMVLEQALLDVEALQPPPEVQAEHDAFRGTLLDVTVLTADVLQATESVTTSAELNALVNQFDPQLTAGDAAFDAACFALQGIADEGAVTVDLRCG